MPEDQEIEDLKMNLISGMGYMQEAHDKFRNSDTLQDLFEFIDILGSTREIADQLFWIKKREKSS